jgi:molybdate transport system substrate-binding protein
MKRSGNGRIGRLAASGAVAAIATLGAVAVLSAASAAAGQAAVARAAGGELKVLGAASLTAVFPMIDPKEQYTFGGSGGLETDIQQGAPADVYAAANAMDPGALYAAGLVYKPVEFATNLLVMIVPPDNPAHISSVSDITKKGVKIVVCNATVPCGDYASTAFANLGITAAADKNIVSEETDVTQVVAEIAAGQGDVGFVYITDALAAKGKVKYIKLPAKAMPHTQDWIAVVKATKNLAAANAFVKLVLSSKGQATLKAAGFGAP